MDLIGIDKTVIKNFTVKSVDMNKLQSESNVDNVMVLRNCKNRYNYFMEQRQDNFNLIKITDNTLFNGLKIDVKKIGENSFIQYATLDLSIKQKGNNNLAPLTVGAYLQKVQAVFKYIQERYGIYMDISDIKFQSIELNATIELNNEFSEYIRAFDLLMDLAPKTYKDHKTHKDRLTNKVDYMVIYNKSIACKFYNKADQLQEVYSFDTGKNILRVEYTILNSEKMKDIFGHCELNKLNDEDIKQFVKTKFESDFISRFEKFKEGNSSKLIKIAKQYRKDHKQWIKSYLMYLVNYELKSKQPLLSDIEDLKEVIKAVDKINFSRNWKQVEKNIPDLDSMIGVNEKVQEIFKKIIAIE